MLDLKRYYRWLR